MARESLDAIEELLPAYAFNALEEEDRELVERALEHEPRYREQLAEYLDTLSQLARMHQPTVPPAALRERVLASRPPIIALRRLEQGQGRQEQAPEASWARSVERTERRLPRLLNAWAAAAAAFAVLVVGLGSFSYYQHQQVQALQGEVAALANEAAETEHRLVAQQALTLWVAQPGITAVSMRAVTSPGITVGTNRSQTPPRGMFMHAPSGESVLVASNMPVLPSYHSYQAWLWDGVGDPYSLGVFNVDDSGYAQVVVDYPQSARSFSTLTVSIEPAGGNSRPSGASVLIGTLDDD